MRRSLLVLSILAAVASAALGQPAGPFPPASIASRQEKLQERDRLLAEANRAAQAGKFDEAAAAAEKILAVECELFGEAHPETGTTVFWLAELHERRGDLASAARYREREVGLKTRLFGADHWQVKDAELARDYNQLRRGMTDEQRLRLRQADEMEGRAASLWRQGKAGEALPVFEKCLELRRSLLGEKHYTFARGLNRLATIYRERGAYARAEQICRRALEVAKQTLGEKHPDYARNLNDLAWLYRSQGVLAKAEPLLRQALELRREALGEGHPDYADSLDSLAGLYRSQGAYAKAEPLYRQALEVTKQALGEKHRNYAAALNNLAGLYADQGAYAQTEQLLREALVLHKEISGEKHPAYAAALNNLALLYSNQGAFPKAERLYRSALELRREALGEGHPDYADSLSNLATLYCDQGVYAKAEPLYRQALEARQQALGEKHPDYAASLNNLASLYCAQGDYAKAEPLLQRALELCGQSLGEKHPSYATRLNSLAVLYNDRGDHAKAEPLYRRALELRKEALGEAHPAYAASLNNLAGVYCTLGAYTKAEPLYRKALELRRQALGEAHPDHARSLNNLAALHHAQKDYGKAERLLRQALEIFSKTPGEKHPDYAAGLNNLAALYLDQGEHAKAEATARRALQLASDHLEQVAVGQAEQTQLAHIRHKRFYLGTFLAAAESARTPAAAYALVLPWKGAVTARQRLTRFARVGLAGADPEARDLFAQLDAVCRRLAALAQKPPEPKRPGELPRLLDELDGEREKLEIALSRRTEEFRRLRQSKRLTPVELQRALPENAALIDFLVYRRREPKQLAKHEYLLAFVVTRQAVARVELGSIEPLGQAVDRFLANLRRDRPAQGEGDPGPALRQLVWEPLERYLGKAKLVLIAPDGPLCRLPFAALPSADGKKYLLEEQAVAVLPVPQMLPELLAPRAARGDDRPPGLLAVGDVDFDGSEADPPPAAAGDVPAWKRRRAGEALHWPRLPGTLGEVLALQDAFRKAVVGGKLTVLRDRQAGEAAFRQQAALHEYLHLATHGFFAPQGLKSALRDDSQATAGREGLRGDAGPAPRFVGHHPGLLSGVVLAGANRPPEEGDDGVLTALEVAELDLTKVELAVLSACETGLGETAGGEGVLGLQRAFQVAGARTTVTSLWKVDDQATRLLMERFYANYWGKGKGALESLREAQLWMLTEGGTRGIRLVAGERAGPRRLPPYYWAAFVLSGDWR